MKVPKNVQTHISNARYYFNAAQRIPSPVADGARILLLLVAWENMHTAVAELRSYIWKTPLPKKLHKEHTAKLQEVRGPIIQLRPFGVGRFVEKAYLTPVELKKLLETCRYGPVGSLPDVAAHFARGWYTDEFEKDLDNKLRWLELELTIFQDIDSGKYSEPN